MPSDQIEFSFPNLAGGYRITSPETPSYNCIAWAASDTGHWWWPTALRGYYWPAEAPRSGSIRDFIAAFGKLGYEPVENAELEEGIEKIAIYADEQGDPTHMARQLGSGKWTSKLGESEDIEHGDVASLEGDCYGKVVRILKRRRVPAEG